MSRIPNTAFKHKYRKLRKPEILNPVSDSDLASEYFFSADYMQIRISGTLYTFCVYSVNLVNWSVLCRKMNVDPDVNYDELARCTDDFNGAQCKAVCVEAGTSKIKQKSF